MDVQLSELLQKITFLFSRVSVDDVIVANRKVMVVPMCKQKGQRK